MKTTTLLFIDVMQFSLLVTSFTHLQFGMTDKNRGKCVNDVSNCRHYVILVSRIVGTFIPLNFISRKLLKQI